MTMEQSLSESDWVTVNDIKQFLYCQRIPFYNRVHGLAFKRTYKMEHGNVLQTRLETLEARRKLKRFGLESGERIFNLRIASDKLKMSGMVDCVIKANGNYYPIDYKSSESGPAANHKIQLCAYSILVEGHFNTVVREAFIVAVTDYANIGQRTGGHTTSSYRIYRVLMDDNLRNKTNEIVYQVRENSKLQRFPSPVKERAKCTFCEFRNFCGDVF